MSVDPNDPALVAAVDEAVDKTTIDWNGHTFTIPARPGKMHPKVLRAVERNNATDVVEGVLGTAEFDKLMDDPNWTVDDMSGLAEKFAEAWGFESTGE